MLQQIAYQLQSENIIIEFIRLNSYVGVSHFALPTLGTEEASPEAKSVRNIYWNIGYLATNIYDIEKLKPGHIIDGPAILESSNTTIVVPVGAKFKMDQHLNGVMEV